MLAGMARIFHHPREKLILGFAPAQFIKLGPLALDLQLISLDLLILLHGLVIAPLELIADERSGTQTEEPSDGGPGRRMTHGGTDDATGRSAAKGADARALLTRRKSASRATRHQRARQQRARGNCEKSIGRPVFDEHVRNPPSYRLDEPAGGLFTERGREKETIRRQTFAL
jgi:hypothetical protein